MQPYSIAAASPPWWRWWCFGCCLLLTLPNVLGYTSVVRWDDSADDFSADSFIDDSRMVQVRVGDKVEIIVPEDHTVACVWNEETCEVKQRVNLTSEINGKSVYTYTVMTDTDMCFFADMDLCDEGVRGIIQARPTNDNTGDRRPRLSEEGMVVAALVVLAMACIMAFVIRFCARHYNPPQRVDPEAGTEGWFSQFWARRLEEEPPPPYIKEEPKPPPYAETESATASGAGTSGSSALPPLPSPPPVAEARSAVSENSNVPAGDPPGAGSNEAAQSDVAQNSDVLGAKPTSDASDENMNAMTSAQMLDADASAGAGTSAGADASTDANANTRALAAESPTSDASNTNAASSSTAHNDSG